VPDRYAFEGGVLHKGPFSKRRTALSAYGWLNVPLSSARLRGDGTSRRTVNFTSAIIACLADDLGESALVLSRAPAKGNGFFYLVRGINCGGHGTYDSADPGQIGSRDAEINASPLSCP